MDRRILVVHQCEHIAAHLSSLLVGGDRQIKLSQDGTWALELLVEGRFQVALVDLKLPSVSGLDVVREIANRKVPVALIGLCPHGDESRGVEALKLGASDYLTTPIDSAQLRLTVAHALADQSLRREVEALRERDREQAAGGVFLARGRSMRELIALLRRTSQAARAVGIVGERGTGKSRLARFLHHEVWGNPGPFVVYCCRALPAALLESELFGTGPHSLTQASSAAAAADCPNRATVVLDQIDQLPAGIQASLATLLRTAQSSATPKGAAGRVAPRLVALTSADLNAAVGNGTLRGELLDALAPLSIELPPLRKREPEDVIGLIDLVFERMLERGGVERSLSLEARACLMQYSWPGNIRELEDVIERVVCTSSESVVGPDALPARLLEFRDEERLLQFDRDRKLPEITAEIAERVERLYLRRVLSTYDGRIDKSAEHCGLSRRSLSSKLGHYSISKELYRQRRPNGRRKTS